MNIARTGLKFTVSAVLALGAYLWQTTPAKAVTSRVQVWQPGKPYTDALGLSGLNCLNQPEWQEWGGGAVQNVNCDDDDWLGWTVNVPIDATGTNFAAYASMTAGVTTFVASTCCVAYAQTVGGLVSDSESGCTSWSGGPSYQRLGGSAAVVAVPTDGTLSFYCDLHGLSDTGQGTPGRLYTVRWDR
jgi:hypothetical protein